MSGKKQVENSEQLSMFMTPREIMQRNWSKTEPRPRAVDSGKRMEGGRDDLMPVEWVDPNDDHFFREGTHGQFKPGYYYAVDDYDKEVDYTTSDEGGWGGTLTVSPARETPYGRFGSYNFLGDGEDPKPIQGELFHQQPGVATTLMANIESRSRTVALLGMAQRHQERNYGPATASSSLTPDSFRLLKHIKGVEQGKKKKTVGWARDEPEEPSEDAGDMRPGYDDAPVPLHVENASRFPSELIETNEVEEALATGQIRQFTEHEVKEGKRFVREQWTSRKPRGKKIPATNRSTRQLSLFPQTAREYWEVNL